MVFVAPAWVPPLPRVPDVSLFEFLLDEEYGRAPISNDLVSYICGVSGRQVTVKEQKEDAELLARALVQDLGWKVNEGADLDKVVCVFAQNTVSSPTCLMSTASNI